MKRRMNQYRVTADHPFDVDPEALWVERRLHPVFAVTVLGGYAAVAVALYFATATLAPTFSSAVTAALLMGFIVALWHSLGGWTLVLHCDEQGIAAAVLDVPPAPGERLPWRYVPAAKVPEVEAAIERGKERAAQWRAEDQRLHEERVARQEDRVDEVLRRKLDQ
uniref:Transmembrane protein n=2 Tax=Intrasporangiaceae TaxID=85021 RepID=Q3MNK0_TERSD|nr:hypothetical protein [Terrabacter sp. DBF63]